LKFKTDMAGTLFSIIQIGCSVSVQGGMLPDKKPVICVDPGHPSEISDGMQTQNGTTETHINWMVGEKLKGLLEKAGYRVVMTKQKEMQAVRNERRADIANRAGAKLTVRLHCDTGGGGGFRVFYPDAQGRHGKVVGPSPWVREQSHKAAEAMHGALLAGLKDDLKDVGVAGDRKTAVGKKMGALIGSIHSKVPTVLIEMVFLNNPKNAEYIKSESGQQKMAEALAEGVRRFVPLR
jgi:N-acetylmuramoyl-L-alanine amidase